jgi:hypothetical protein
MKVKNMEKSVNCIQDLTTFVTLSLRKQVSKGEDCKQQKKYPKATNSTKNKTFFFISSPFLSLSRFVAQLAKLCFC